MKMKSETECNHINPFAEDYTQVGGYRFELAKHRTMPVAHRKQNFQKIMKTCLIGADCRVQIMNT